MQDRLQELLDSLATRNRKSRWGIGTAHTYLADMIGCFTGGVCPSKLFDVTSEDQWAQFIEKSKAQLTFCDPDLEVKDFDQSTDIPPHCVATFKCCVTSTRKDRDGDILEVSGATLDPKAPLLWQHLPAQPIGKSLGETSRTKEKLFAKCAIADTELGRDAALLTEFGALRISHGFDPREFEPLKGKDAGWHIKEYEIQEISLVSVPSNVDAGPDLQTFESFSRGKFHHPAVKALIKKRYDERPVISGWTKDIDAGKFRMSVDLQAGKVEIVKNDESGEPEGTAKACTCGNEDKQNEPATTKESAKKEAGTKGTYASFSGTFEEIGEKLAAKLRVFIAESEINSDYGWIGGIREKDAIIGCYGGYPDYGVNFYLVPWKTVKGEPEWYGSPEPVAVKLTVVDPETGDEKSSAPNTTKGASVAVELRIEKAGRSLSGKHEKCLKSACGHMKDAMDMDMTDSCHTLVNKAHDLVQQVLAGNQKPTEQSEPGGEEEDYERDVDVLIKSIITYAIDEHADYRPFQEACERAIAIIAANQFIHTDLTLREELAMEPEFAHPLAAL